MSPKTVLRTHTKLLHVKHVYRRFTETEALSFAQATLSTGIKHRNLEIESLPPIGIVIGPSGVEFADLTSPDKWNSEIQAAEEEYGLYLSYMILMVVELEASSDCAAVVYFDTKNHMLKGLLLNIEDFRVIDRFAVAEKLPWLTHRLDEAYEV